MRHKIFLTATAAALIAAMGVLFAGCGKSAANIAGEQVSEEEWKAAFAAENFENFKCVYTYVNQSTVGGEAGDTEETITYVIADKKEHVTMAGEYSGSHIGVDNDGNEVKDYDMEVYYEYGALLTTAYVKNDADDWEKSTTLSSELGLYRKRVPSWIALASAYSAFEYSAEKQGYVFVLTGDGAGSALQQAFSGLTDAVIKIEDGKLAAIYGLTERDQEGEPYYKNEYGYLFTYGGQSVSLPKVAE